MPVGHRNSPQHMPSFLLAVGCVGMVHFVGARGEGGAEEVLLALKGVLVTVLEVRSSWIGVRATPRWRLQ